MEEIQQDLLGLMSHRARHSVSIYVPCADAHSHPDVFVARWKNATRVARERLATNGGTHHTTIPPLTPELRSLARKCKALAVFFSDHRDAVFYPLSFETEQLVAVSNRFHLKPVLAAVSHPQACFVLALSRHSVRLAMVDEAGTHELELDPAMPRSLESVTRTLMAPHLDLHTVRDGQGVFHGQDQEERRRDADLKRFLHAVAKAVETAVDMELSRRGGKQTFPVVLAGVHELTASFRNHTGMWILDGEITGNPDHQPLLRLAEEAVDHAHAASLREAKELEERVRALSHTPQVKFGVIDILRAAHDGRVEALLLQDDATVWGSFDPERREAQLNDEPDGFNEDLLDRAAVDTYRQGGTVQFVDERTMREINGPAVALLRY